MDGCDGIPAVHAVGQWEDTELNSRCRQLMNYYLVTQPLSELLKFPEILEYLPNARLSQRFHETVDSPETLIRMVKEVSLLMLVPSLLNERLKNLEDEISSTTNADATDLLKEELRRLCNLPQLGQEIQMALANASRSPDSNQKSSFD